MAENQIMRKAIPDLLNKKYYIPEYQRGYRWEDKQVLDLLNDLYAFFSGDTKGQFYCLQPIVVKRKVLDKEDDWYEVIDGQQRLTTLRILMQIFDQINASPFRGISHHTYTIRYATRPEMSDIFDSITLKDGKIDDSKNEWNRFIDSIYIYNAARTILKWFIEDESRIGAFQLNFYQNDDITKKSVQVVWYETTEDKDPHDIFNRMNSLKVDLSCSELIRSMFLSSTTFFEVGDLSNLSDSVRDEIRKDRLANKRTSINERWDEIEQQMRDKKFQSFLTRRQDNGRNAIGLLFDIMSGKFASDKAFPCPYTELHKDDELYTYLFFKQLLNEDKDAWKTWQRVLETVEKLYSWYKDRDLYHQIGFLNAVASDKATDDAICSLLSSKVKRSELKQVKVVDMIKSEMVLPMNRETNRRVDSLEQLEYTNKTHYEYIKKLLLLYNVETTRLQKEGDFFPFDRYRYDFSYDGDKIIRKCKVWTLEHIHAQNSDCLPEKNKNSWYEWIDCNEKALLKVSLGNLELVNEQKNVLDALKRDKKICTSKTYSYDEIRALFEMVFNFYALLDTSSNRTTSEHQLSNLTLLDSTQNPMVGKSPFEVKRQLVCNQLSDNVYYPICTQRVFLKMYDKEETQIHSWGYRDRIYYYDDIKSKLKTYIDNSAL